MCGAASWSEVSRVEGYGDLLSTRLRLTHGRRATWSPQSGLPRLTIMAARVLVVEDDVTMAEVLRAYLTRAGYQVECSGDGGEAAQLWQRISPDVVILDIMLPGLSDWRCCAGDGAAVIMCVIVLSARGEEEDRLVGLETGADDYVVKPFSPREVVLRVEALLRRTERLAGMPMLNSTVTLGPVTIDSAAREARRSGRPLALTMREFDLLTFLASHAGQTFSKRNCCAESGAGTSATPPRSRCTYAGSGRSGVILPIRPWY